MSDSYALLAHALELIVALFCWALLLLTQRRPLHGKLDRPFCLLLLIAGMHYFSRFAGLHRLEHLTAILMPSVFFSMMVRLFKIKTTFRFRFSLFIFSCFLFMSSLFGNFYQTRFSLCALFLYQALLLSSLGIFSFQQSFTSAHRLESKFYRQCAYWVWAAFGVMAFDWIFYRFFLIPRLSTLFVIPFSFWVIFVFGSGGLHSARKAFLKASIEIIPLNISSLILFKTFSLNQKFPLYQWSFLFFIVQFAIWVLRFREKSINRWSKKSHALPPLHEINWIQSSRWVSDEEIQNIGLSTIDLRPFLSNEEPAIRPLNASDWLRIDGLNDSQRDAFLFMWEALKLDALIYLPHKKAHLGILLHSFAYSADYREQIDQLSKQLKEEAC